MKNADMPAMPIINKQGFPTIPEAVDDFSSSSIGLTKLEYFAGLAMQGALAHPKMQASMKVIAEKSVEQALALIAELESQNAN